ncbi:MAG: hypothetical protein J6O61_15070 [Butyrivibrio sp.]|uniref:hypothetical protein n=1 Tax=Butyrivibrio sp. TaxID=28121 RepID=UPI001B025463|nr:hypothetical protein [Butyrivibrio sp.]MBO6242124.1 hypothetical protein [Butyrivibrio sp.]
MLNVRAWLIAVIDVATRCILGYSVSQAFNYDQYDVIDAIKDSIVPKSLKELTITGLKYPSNGGYYSTAFPELKYAVFDSIMLDNAKAHLSAFTHGKLTDDLKCTVNYGSVATPETRGIIERFFETLETSGFHKLPMTTASSARDLKRKSPEKETLEKSTYQRAYVMYDDILHYHDTLRLKLSFIWAIKGSMNWQDALSFYWTQHPDSGINWNYRRIREGIRLDSLDVSLRNDFSFMDKTLVSLYIIDDLFKCLWKQYKALAHRPQGVRVEDGWQELRVPEYYLCTKSETGTMYLYRKKQF